MTSHSTNSPASAQIVNVALFMVALVGLGGLLVREFVERSSTVEIADEENRSLAQFPELSASSFVEGRFARGVDEWIADHFPARERFMAAHFWLEQRRGFRSKQAITVYAVAIDNDADLEPFDDELGPERLDREFEIGDEGEADADDEAEAEAEGEADKSEITRSEGIMVVDGRAMQLFSAGPKGSRRYAAAINEYAEALAGKVAVYVLIVPTAQTYYLPESYTGRVRHEPPNISATYAMLDPAIKTVDVVGALAEHADEYIYFRTDHHWTGRGAYYAYAAFCRVAGFEPVALDSMESGTIAPYRGSLYSYTHDENLRGHPDQVEYWHPPVESTVERLTSDGHRTAHSKGELVRANSKGYGVFLGGDHPLLVAHTTNKTGRRALLVKNSYGNPFAVFLVSHFDEVLIVDYRKFDSSVLGLIEDYGITDLIFLNGAITANARFHIDRLARIMNPKTSRRRKAAAAP